MISILFILIWISYACLEAIREAYYYHLNCGAENPVGYNLHTLFTIQRAIVLGILSGLFMSIQCNSPINIVSFITSCLCVFPGFHDSFYYYMRNRLNPLIYTKKWFDQSTTSTAFSTKFFTPVMRTCLAIGGILGLILIK